MRYAHILVAVDLRHDVRHLLQRAGKFAQRMGARLHIITVLPRDEPGLSQGDTSHLANLQRETLDYLQQQVAALPSQHGECRVCCGVVADEILRAVVELKADVLILGARQRPGLLSWLQQQAAEPLLARLGCDLLLLDEDRPFWREPLHITLLVDLDAAGQKVLRRATALARQQGAQLLVRHVLASNDESLRAVAERQLASWLVGLPLPLPRWELVSGAICEWLTRSLASHESHLLIIGGTHLAPHPQAEEAPLARLLHEPGDVMVLR